MCTLEALKTKLHELEKCFFFFLRNLSLLFAVPMHLTYSNGYSTPIKSTVRV